MSNVVNAEKPFIVHPESGDVIVVDRPLQLADYTVIVEATDQAINPAERRVSLAVVRVIHILIQLIQLLRFICLAQERKKERKAP